MKKTFSLCLSLFVFVLFLPDVQYKASAAGSIAVSYESLLDEIVCFKTASNFPTYTAGQESSYDRRSVAPHAPGWWANDDGFGFIRTDIISGRSEKVLFDQSGPGVITRIWMTSTNKNGTLRFYFDGNRLPDWTIPAYDLMKWNIQAGNGLRQAHPNYDPKFDGRGGSTLFLPISYAQNCKITLEEHNSTATPPRYYAINYRTYPHDTSIETFTYDVYEKNLSKIQTVDSILLQPLIHKKNLTEKTETTLNPNEHICINLPQGEYAVNTIKIVVKTEQPELYEQLMRKIILETEFDKKKTSWVPLGEFSGGGLGAPNVKSWYLDSDGKGSITSRWFMPYKNDGKIILTNHSNESVHIFVSANIEEHSWIDNTLYFHASWKQENNLPLVVCGHENNPSNAYDWNFAYIEGKGVYMGDVLSLFNYSPRWYGEGDEKIWVDDDIFPSHFGTGTEDYYNCSWAPVIPFQTPFGGAPRADKPSSHGYNTFFRSRNLDAIPFKNMFQFDLEMLSWKPGAVDYSTTIFWYGDYNAKAKNISGLDAIDYIMPESGVYKIPNAIEFEQISPLDVSPSFEMVIQDMTPFTSGEWSGFYQLLLKHGEIGDYVLFRFENLAKVRQHIILYLTKANDFGMLSFTVNGQLSPVTYDGYASSVSHSGPVDIGEFMPNDDGFIELKITLTGTNQKTQGEKTLIGLDCIQIIPGFDN